MQDNKGLTALMLAANDGRSGLAYLLHDAGADPYIKDNKGARVFDYAEESLRGGLRSRERDTRFKVILTNAGNRTLGVINLAKNWIGTH